MSPPRPTQRQRRSAFRSTWALLEKYARPTVTWTLLATVVATGYILYGIFSGQLTASAEPRIIANLQLMGQVLAVSAGLSAVFLIIITADEVAWAVVVGITGLAYLLGTPFMISNHMRAATSPAAEVISTWGTVTGLIIIAVAGLRLVIEVYQQLAYGGLRRKPAAEDTEETKTAKGLKVKTAWPWTPCWEMPFCHEAIKEMCPAFNAGKTCWRFGRGCNCDPGLIESLVRTGGIGASSDSQQRRRQQEYIRSDLQADVPRQRERTIPCAKCPIYMEHQRAKFRFVNPLLVVGTIVGLIVFYQPLLKLYNQFLTGMANIASRFTYGSQVDPQQWFDNLNSPAVQVSFVLIFGLLVLSWVLKLAEWVILVKKL